MAVSAWCDIHNFGFVVLFFCVIFVKDARKSGKLKESTLKIATFCFFRNIGKGRLRDSATLFWIRTG